MLFHASDCAAAEAASCAAAARLLAKYAFKPPAVELDVAAAGALDSRDTPACVLLGRLVLRLVLRLRADDRLRLPAR